MTMTRRQLLGSSALGALCLAFQNPLTAAASPACRPAVVPVVAPGDAADPPRYPYQLFASSTLSEDYFLTDEIVLDPVHDTVAPIVGADGAAHALVVLHQDSNPAARNLSLVHPSSTSQSGYLHIPLTALGTGQLGMAAVGGPNDTIGICYVDQSAQVWTTTVTLAGVSTAPVQVQDALTQFTSDLVSGVNAQGVGRVMYLSTTGNAGVDDLVVIDPFTGSVSTVSIDKRYLADHQGTMTLSGVQAYVTAGQNGAPDTVSGVLLSPTAAGIGSPQMAWFSGPVGSTLSPTRVMTPNSGTVYGVDTLAAPPLPIPQQPGSSAWGTGLLWADTSGNVYVGVMGDDQTITLAAQRLLANATFGPAAQPVTSAEWYWDPVAGVARVYVLAGGTVYLQTIDMRQAPYLSPAVPLQPQVQQMYRPDRGASAATSIIVAATSTTLDQPVLSVLARSAPADPWSTAPIHTTSTTILETSTYRTLLTLADQGHIPVATTAVTLTPETDMLSFGLGGGTLLPAGVASTVKTDPMGRIMLAVPAGALRTGGVQVAYPSGQGATLTAQVAPDGELHRFLAGQGSITGYAKVSDFLTSQAGPGQAIPDLPTDAATIAAVASAVTNTMTAGLNATAAPGTPGAASEFTLIGIGTGIGTGAGAPTLKIGAPKTVASSAQGWWDAVGHDVTSLRHAMERGLAKVTSVVSAWDATARQWSLTLELTISGYAQVAVSWVVKTADDAVAAVHGVLAALGADLSVVLTLLRTQVKAILTDAAVIGHALNGWLTYPPGTPLDQVPNQGLGLAIRAMESAATTVANAFSAAEADVQSLLGRWDPGAPTLTPTDPSDPLAVKIQWILEKVMAAQDAGKGVAPSTPTFDAFGRMETTLSQSTVPQQLLDGVDGVFGAFPSGKAAVAGSYMGAVKQTLGTTVVGALTLADALVQDLFTAVEHALDDVNTAIATPLDDLPIVGQLLKAIGVPTSLTLAQAGSLAVGFGMAIAGRQLAPGLRWVPDSAYTAYGVAVPSGPPAPPGVGPRGYGSPTWAQLTQSAAVTDWALFLRIGYLVLNLLTAAVAAPIQNIYVAEKQPMPANVGAVLLLIGALLNVVVYPFDTFQNDLSWTPTPKGGVNNVIDANLLWAMGFAPVLAGIITTRINDADSAIWSPVVNCVGGVINLIGDLALSLAVDPSDATGLFEGIAGPFPAIVGVAKMAGTSGPQAVVTYVSMALDSLTPAVLVDIADNLGM